MSKRLLFSVVSAGVALIVLIQLRTSSIPLHPSIDGDSIVQERRVLRARKWKKPRLVSSSHYFFLCTYLVLRALTHIHRVLFSSPPHTQPWLLNDPKTTESKELTLPPINICNRRAPIEHNRDVQLTKKYGSCLILNQPPEETTAIVLDGIGAWGRTGNNLIEFFHALQIGQDKGYVVAIRHGGWVSHLLLNMWFAVQYDDFDDMTAWMHHIEQTFCVFIYVEEQKEKLERFKEVIEMDTEELFRHKTSSNINDYVEYQGHVLRNLWRNYHRGRGFNLRRQPVSDNCSVMNAMFGSEKRSAMYSVIHSRSLEGEPGKRLLGRISEFSGCDPLAALEMRPDYIKAILAPLDMLKKPIIFITDNQAPEILERLQADPDIGPNLRLIPDEVSWVGGDVTVGVMADVFIGNPASTFSGFIAKSRVALGYNNTYMFRKIKEDGTWGDVGDHRTIFDKKIMHAMA